MRSNQATTPAVARPLRVMLLAVQQALQQKDEGKGGASGNGGGYIVSGDDYTGIEGTNAVDIEGANTFDILAENTFCFKDQVKECEAVAGRAGLHLGRRPASTTA